MKRLAATRFIIAWLLTLGAVPYAWGWALFYPMSVGEIHWTSTASLAGLLLLLFLLTWGLHRTLRGERWAAWGRGLLGVAWVTALAVVIWLAAQPTISRAALVSLFVPATLWLPWLGWLGYRGGLPRWKLIVLGVLLILIIPFLVLVRIERLTGDARPFFAWRFADRPAVVSSDDAEVPAPASIGPAGPGDSPQYLGPNRDGSYPNHKLADWTAAPPREVWRRAIGTGWSGCAIVNGYVFTQEQRTLPDHDPEECVTCYRLSDGARVWVHREPGQFQSSMGGDGPRATPTVADGRLYAMGPRGLLLCLEAASGHEVWRVNVIDDCGGPNLMHGVCGAPLVDGDRIIVAPPAEGGPCLAAYHRDSGKKIWQSGTWTASYSSPMLWQFDETSRQILLFAGVGLSGFDATTGRALWHYPWTNSDRINCSQPLPDAAGPGTVLVTTGYGTGSALVRVNCESPDRWTPDHSWKRNVMKTKFTTAVIHEAQAYGLDDGILACIDTVNGRLRWKGERYRHGQVIRAGDRLIVQLENGEVALVEASPAAFKELGRVRGLRGEDGTDYTTWNVPALAGRYLVIRNFREAVCYELSSR